MTPSPLTPPERDAHPSPVLLAVIADDPTGEFDAIGPDPTDADDPSTEPALRRARQHVIGCASCNAAVSRFAGNALLLAASSGSDGQVAPNAVWFDDLVDRAGDPIADPYSVVAGAVAEPSASASDVPCAPAADAPGASAIPEAERVPGAAAATAGSGTRVICLARRPYQRAGLFAAAGIALLAAVGIGGLASRVNTGRDENAANAVGDGRAQETIAVGGDAVESSSIVTAAAPVEAGVSDAVADAAAETVAAQTVAAETVAAETVVAAEAITVEAAATETAAASAEEQEDGVGPNAVTETPAGDDVPPLAELEPAGDADASVAPERARVAPTDDLPAVDEAGALAEVPAPATRPPGVRSNEPDAPVTPTTRPAPTVGRSPTVRKSAPVPIRKAAGTAAPSAAATSAAATASASATPAGPAGPAVAAFTGTATTLGLPTPAPPRLTGRDLGVLDTAESVDDAVAALFARVLATEPGAFGAVPPSRAPATTIASSTADIGTRFSAAAAATARDMCFTLLVQQSPAATRFVAVGEVRDRVLVFGISGSTGSGTVVILESRATSCQLVERRPF